MKNVQVLDCTLRDGGRIINCKFEDMTIYNIANELTESGIDIVELGFLRSTELVNYDGNSTFFTDVSQMSRFIPQNKKNTTYVAFIDYNMYNFEDLKECDNTSVTGIRVGFTKKQYLEDIAGIKKALYTVKEKGYKLFIQTVNSLAYSDKDMLNLIDMVNEIQPYSFGIVDTYGAMYLEDIIHYYNVVDYNLNSDICIDIHSHNNFQLSFAFAQETIRLSGDKRNIILDSTLNGMGKCAGNLNTELIVDYLIRKKNYDYELDGILDIIDRYLAPLKNNYSWGYSIPAFMAGIYKSHPNNVIYLTEKYRLSSKDIKYIISAIDEDKRQRYDYDNIQRIYKEYNSSKYDDQTTICNLRSVLKDKDILVLVPGVTVDTFKDKICEYADSKKMIVISVNFIPEYLTCDYYFYANSIHWGKVYNYIEKKKSILVSSLHEHTEETNIVDYSSLLVDNSVLADNSTMMLLNLLKKLEVKSIRIAGFDGLKQNEKNYINELFMDNINERTIEETNREIRKMYNDFKLRTKDKINVQIITPTLYE